MGGPPVEDARYYHLKVSNSRRFSPAHDVRVVLLRVEEPGPNGELQVTWTGDIPIVWRHQAVFPILRTIGSEAYADLCSVRQSKILRIHPLIGPYNLKAQWNRACIMMLTLQAKGTEVDSKPLRVSIAWDGEWEPGETEMRRRLQVDEANEQVD